MSPALSPPITTAAGALSHLWSNTVGMDRSERGHHGARKARIALLWPELAEAIDTLVEAGQ